MRFLQVTDDFEIDPLHLRQVDLLDVDESQQLAQQFQIEGIPAIRIVRQGRLLGGFDGLRPEEQAVFLLRQNADLTYEEIAELRRSPVGTVKTQMRAALHKLKQVLKEK